MSGRLWKLLLIACGTVCVALGVIGIFAGQSTALQWLEFPAYVEEGLSAAIERQPRREQPRRKLDGVAEAHLVAAACSPPPAGQSRWTLQLLSDRLVELQIVESVSRECVRQTLKKTRSSLG